MTKDKVKIFLIEDDEEDYVLFKAAINKLKSMTCTVEWHTSIEGALPHFIENSYDVYFVDYKLGKYNGLDFIQNARLQGSNAPIVLVTGLGEEDLAIKALRLGADDYLLKSEITSYILEKTIRYAIERRKAQITQEEHRVHLEQQKYEERYGLILDSIIDYAIFMLDSGGKVKTWNKGAEYVLGYTEEEIIGKHFSIFYTSEDKRKKLPQQELEIAVNQGKAQEDNFIVKKDGSLFFASGFTTPLVENNKNIGFVKIIRDITERIEAEKRKDDFISMASHELKTPVTTMKVLSQALLKQVEQSGEQLLSKKYLVKIDEQINKLNRLIAELLDVSKIYAGKLEMQKEVFDIEKLVQNIVENFQYTTDHTITIKVGEKSLVEGDKDRIGQVIINLLTNAIKYSKNSEKINIFIKKNKTQVHVSVQDFGIGIAKKHHGKLFERFYQVTDPAEKTFPGLGMGLYIASEIVKQHNGKIWVESEKGKGATFTIAIPIKNI